MRQGVIALALLVTFVIASPAAKRAIEWQEGTLADVSTMTGSRLVGTSNNGHGVIAQHRDDATYYTIVSEGFSYVAKRTLTSRGDRQLDVTVNAPIKFAILGDDFLLLDESGKPHKLTLEKKILEKLSK